ncbi:hypothetical protein AB9K26_04790 [Psychroserpens sp. XS_ASV72]|uniref:hypothetical protein n=1 Tax=Psychroserpens sp. XS_ASV72 TaxID=3241293 RepID=UPI003512D6F4
MKYQLFYLIFFLSLPLNVLSQSNPKIETAYPEYFNLPRETMFVHLNKTTFISGEEIWFKTYTYDRRQHKVFKETTNIYVGIYNSEGKQIKKQLFLAENGRAHGSFKIDSTYTSGTYYVKASTNWMQNFKENDAFVQKILIVDKNYAEPQKEAISYDFQFLPEGGHCIADTKNHIGFKAIDHLGQGVVVKGKVLDSENFELLTFESNTFGMGKFIFRPEPNKAYTAEITFKNGETITKQLPKAELEGISMLINNSDKNEIVMSFYTNNETLKNIKNKSFKIAIHKDGDMKLLPLSFGQSTRKSLALNKEVLFEGVNTITLIDSENRPINERLFFNSSSLKSESVFLSQLPSINDSLALSMYHYKKENFNLSISVLPETTISYQPNHNIISAFYLRPYVKGYIETPQYYFYKPNAEKSEDLDLLLLTQGWSRYEWNDIFKNPPTEVYDFEQGITLAGGINGNYADADSLYMYSTQYYSAQFIPLDKNKGFKIPNFKVADNENLKFSYVNKKMQFLKPTLNVTYKVFNSIDSLSSKTVDVYKFQKTYGKPILENWTQNSTVDLDEVVVVSSSKKKTPVVGFQSFERSFKKSTKIFDENAGLTYPDVISYLRTHGYKVSQTFGQVVIQSRIPNSISGEQYPEPTIYLDDVQLQSFNVLYELPSANIEKIYIDKRGLGQSMSGGSGGVIRIYMKENSVFDIKEASKVSANYTVSEPTIGFTSPKTFYTPLYNSYNNSFFKEYGVISWIPKLELPQNVSSKILLPKTETKVIKLYIEGIADDGTLISEIKTLTLE